MLRADIYKRGKLFCFNEIILLLQIITKYIFQLYSISVFLNLYSYAFHLLYRIQHAMLHSLNRCIRVKQIKHIVGQSRVYPRFSCTNVFDKSQVYSHSHVVYVSAYAFIKIQDCVLRCFTHHSTSKTR